MPNKIKLNLEDLKVNSFVTSLSDEEKKHIKGGSEINGTVETIWSNR